MVNLKKDRFTYEIDPVIQEIHRHEMALPLEEKTVLIENQHLQKALQWGVNGCKFTRTIAMSPQAGLTGRQRKRMMRNAE